MVMNEKIKKIIPPLLFDLKRILQTPKLKKFKSYEDVFKKIDNEFYNSENTDLVRVKTKMFVEMLKTNEYTLDYEEKKLITFFFLKNKKPLKVLDVGGGSGIHFHVLNNFNEKMEVEWTVLETPEMVKSNTHNDFKKLYFTDDLNSLKEKNFDVIYMSGLLQYLSDPYSFLKKIFEIKSNQIIITRTPFLLNGEEFYSIQKSFLSEKGPSNFLPEGIINKDLQHPIFFFNLNKFEGFLKNNNLKFITIDDGQWDTGREVFFKKTILINKI